MPNDNKQNQVLTFGNMEKKNITFSAKPQASNIQSGLTKIFTFRIAMIHNFQIGTLLNNLCVASLTMNSAISKKKNKKVHFNTAKQNCCRTNISICNFLEQNLQKTGRFDKASVLPISDPIISSLLLPPPSRLKTYLR